MVIQAIDLIRIFSVSLGVTDRALRIGATVAMEVIVKIVPGVGAAGV